ncbi:MAG: HWE histidine kinase domain-containing protein [Hyphomicrobiales bacterium]
MTDAPPIDALQRKTEELARSEERYRYALMAGRLVHWETDLTTGTRIWREDSMALFGLKLENGIGRLGGDNDEFRKAVHPDDRHLVTKVYELAQTQDWFPVEYRIVRPDGSIRWLSGGGQVASRAPDGKPLRMVHVVTDITERKNAEEHVQSLLRELTHRGKNLLAVIQAIASQTGRRSDTIEEFQESFSRRLQGLAASHDLLVTQNWKGASLGDLLRDQLGVFAGTDSSAIALSGPEVFLNPQTTESLGLALHELATNAVKHGALSSPDGKVSVSWAIEPAAGASPERLNLAWLERGGPAVSQPSRNGFGHVVFERIVARSLNAELKMVFDPEGLSWQLSIPTVNQMNRRTIFKDRASWEEAE